VHKAAAPAPTIKISGRDYLAGQVNSFELIRTYPIINIPPLVQEWVSGIKLASKGTLSVNIVVITVIAFSEG